VFLQIESFSYHQKATPSCSTRDYDKWEVFRRTGLFSQTWTIYGKGGSPAQFVAPNECSLLTLGRQRSSPSSFGFLVLDQNQVATLQTALYPEDVHAIQADVPKLYSIQRCRNRIPRSIRGSDSNCFSKCHRRNMILNCQQLSLNSSLDGSTF
jgi:hypothetical protein